MSDPNAPDSSSLRSWVPFVTHMVHDVKNPLTGIQGYLQLIRQIASNLQDPKLIRYSTKAMQGCLELNEFLTNLSDVMKIVAGQLKPETASVDLTALLNTTAGLFDRRINETAVQMKDPGRVVTVSADPRLLERALHNILIYSATTAPAQSSITMSVSTAASAVVTIEDAGPAFPDELLKFIRSNPDSLKYDGEVIVYNPGFSIQYAHAVTRLMKGRLELVSLPSGRRFALTLS